MSNTVYPKLEINLEAIEHNARVVLRMAENYGIEILGVVKGVTGLLPCSKVFEKSGMKTIGSSRLEQIEEAKDGGVTVPLALVRIPMLSEVPEVIRLCDYSLNSEVDVIRALDKEAKAKGKTHGVILMVDVGDLREGFFDEKELVEAALIAEKECENIELLGVGTNVGCYGSVMPKKEVLDILVERAEAVENAIGRKLKYISGGATSSIMRMMDGDIPPRINHLRIGEGILLARDLEVYYNYDLSDFRQDIFTLKAEIIELKNKPTKPIGPQEVDAFGKKPYYEDRGIRKRAIIGIGKVDYGPNIEEIFPGNPDVKIIGASSDHTILDVEDVKSPLRVGDILEFDINYASMVYLTNCKNVKVEYV